MANQLFHLYSPHTFMKKPDFLTIIKICGLFIVSRLLILASFFIALHKYISYSVKGGNFHYFKNELINCFGCWDSGWYLNVATNGYIKEPMMWGQSNYGFFPFYPWAMRIVAVVVHDPFIAGLIVSNLLLLTGSFFLYMLCIKLYQSKRIAMLAVGLLYFFPGSYLLSGVFSESAFLCFSVMCVYFFETDNYLLCGISGFFLTLTRPFCILILLPLFISYIYRYGIQFRAISILLVLIPLGTISFFAYCYFTTGDFLFYVHAKQIGWHTEYAKPWKVLIAGLKTTDDNYIRFNSFYTLFWLALMVLLIRYIPFYLFVWIVLLIVAPLSNGRVNLICMPRYILVCFPLIMMIAAWASKYRLGWLVYLLFAVVNLILSGFFALGYQFTA